MSVTARDLSLPSFAADALCLGPHWIYDQAKVAALYPGGIRCYDAPKSPYHPGKQAGDFTHYGDQMLALLRSVLRRGGYQHEGWREDWSEFWSKNTTAYRDGATKATLDHLVHGRHEPSDSHDFAGASRMAPVLAALAGAGLEERVQASRSQTALTHGDAETIDCAEFFTRVVDGIGSGLSIPQALERASAISYSALDACAAQKIANASVNGTPAAVGTAMGLSCSTSEAFPLTLYLLLKFAERPAEALVQNAMIGGDSAARGLLIGLVMGAAHGTDWMPRAWIDELNAGSEIDALLKAPV